MVCARRARSSLTLGDCSACSATKPARLGGSESLGEFFLKLRPVASVHGGEGLADLREEVGFEKAGDLGALGVHHAVDAEVEVGLVEHEELGQEGFEFFEIGFHVVSPAFVFRALARALARSLRNGSNELLIRSGSSSPSMRWLFRQSPSRGFSALNMDK